MKNWEAEAVAFFVQDGSTTFEQLGSTAKIADIYRNDRDALVENAVMLADYLAGVFEEGRASATTNAGIDIHADGEAFDEKYPPNTDLPASDEYDHEDGQAGMYGMSEHDQAILKQANPLCVWTFVDGTNGTYAESGFHIVNRICWFISAVPREKNSVEEYQLTVDL